LFLNNANSAVYGLSNSKTLSFLNNVPTVDALHKTFLTGNS